MPLKREKWRKYPYFENAVLEWNFEILTSPTPIFRNKKPKYEIWCHSDTVRKSGTIHITEETGDVNSKIMDFWTEIKRVS